MEQVKKWTESEIKELLQFYQRDFQIKTGGKLVCLERKRVAKGAKVLMKDKVIPAAAKFYGIPEEKITGGCREKEVVEIKQMCAKILSLQQCNSETIAAKLGNMERSTITNTLRRFEKMHKENKWYREKFQQFRNYCKEEINKVTYYEATGSQGGKG